MAKLTGSDLMGTIIERTSKRQIAKVTMLQLMVAMSSRAQIFFNWNTKFFTDNVMMSWATNLLCNN